MSIYTLNYDNSYLYYQIDAILQRMQYIAIYQLVAVSTVEKIRRRTSIAACKMNSSKFYCIVYTCFFEF